MTGGTSIISTKKIVLLIKKLISISLEVLYSCRRASVCLEYSCRRASVFVSFFFRFFFREDDLLTCKNQQRTKQNKTTTT